MKNSTIKMFKPITLLIFLMSMAIPWSGVMAQQEENQQEEQETVRSENKSLKNGPQPTRYNYRKLAKDPSSPFYNPNSQKWPEDNVQERFNYDFERLKNPKTGEIPADVRQRELDYVLSPASRLQNNSGIPFGTENIENAGGDQTSPWVSRGPFNVGGRTRALAIDVRNEDIILAGGVAGGMWRSTDQGLTWNRVTASDQHPGITAVVQDTRVGFEDTWYYATGERLGASQSGRNGSAFYQGNGIYKSTDNGLTWVSLTATINPTPQSFDNPLDLIFGLDINPTNGDLYVATFDGIQRSTDGGTTFTEVLPSDFDNFTDIHITSTGVLYATLDAGAGAVGTASGLFRSVDGGLGTWVNITDAAFPTAFSRTVIYTAPSNENILYLLADGTGTAPVGHDFWKYTYVSGDGTGAGGVWENRSANLPAFGGPVGSFNSQGGYDLYVRVHPTDPDLVLIGGTNIYRSTDGFATSSGTWVAGYSPLNNVSLYTNHHPDQHGLLFFPSNPDKVLTSHDGGISITQDITADNAGVEPVAWTALNNGYLTTQVYALSIGPQDQLMAGFQDNSTWFTNNDTPTDPWVDLFSGDGSYNAFNDDGTLRYVSSQNGNVSRLTYPDANSSVRIARQDIDPSGLVNALFVNPFELDPNDDNIMYFGDLGAAWRNDDLPNATAATGWTRLTNAPVAGNVSTIGISENPANVVYLGSTAGSIVRIDNASVGNPTGIDVSSGKGLPAGNVTSIDVNPFDSNDVIVAFSNYSIQSIFHTTDGGNTWVNVSGNLEENPDGSGAGPSVRWVASVGNRDRYFAGTSTGLYSTLLLNGDLTIWTQESLGGINNAVVEQVRARDNDGLVVAGTHGNGLYSANYEVTVGTIPAVIPGVPIAPVSVLQNSADVTIDASTTFISTLDPPQPISIIGALSSDAGLVTTSISGTDVILSIVPGNSGSALITLTGQDGLGNEGTTTFQVEVIPILNTFPYEQPFATGNLPDGFGATGAFPWLVNNGGTPSTGTGPLDDNTEADGSGFYVYAEATGPGGGAVGELTSPIFDLSSLSDPELTFSYHMFGTDMGTLEVDVIDFTSGTQSTIFTLSGPQQANQADPYLPAFINLSAFSDNVVQLVFRGIRGVGFTSDIAIDDIRVAQAPIAVNAVAPIELLSNSDDVVVDLSNLFVSTLTPPEAITLEIFDNSNPTLIGTTLSGTNLTLSVLDFAGTARINMRGSDAQGNESFSAIEVQVEGVVQAFPYTLDFEGATLPGLGVTVSGTFPWFQDANGTPSGGTGPLGDNTQADGSGLYIYTEATGAAEGDVGEFTTPIIQFSDLANPRVAFSYHMFGQDMGTLEIDLLNTENDTRTTIFSLSGQQQANQNDPYIRQRINLGSLPSINQGRLVFRGIRGAGFTSDIAVDDIVVDNQPAADMAVNGVLGAPISQVGVGRDFSIELFNAGTQAQSNFDVSYQVDALAPVVETFTASIAPGETVAFTFATQFTPAAEGTYILQVNTLLAGDEDNGNDLSGGEGIALNVAGALPYAESFESGAGGWITTGNNNSWEVGAPAGTSIANASDGTQAWVTNLAGNYNDNEASYVLSPIFDFTSTTNPSIAFDINYDIETNFDGAILQVTNDNGITWQNVGLLNDLLNWYNQENFGSLGFASVSTDSWTGTSGEYLLASHAIDGMGGESEVILRVVFASDGSATQEGFAFDNVRVLEDSDLFFQAECSADVVMSAETGICSADVTILQPVITNASGNITFVNSFNGTDEASDVYPVGTTVVTWTMTDDVSGFTRECSFTVTVTDDEDPVFTLVPEDILVFASNGDTETVVEYDDLEATDNCMIQTTVTQSGDQTLVAGNFVVCPPGPNSYLRVFNLPEFGIDNDFLVESLDFGIEQSTAVGGAQPSITANIYTYDPTTDLLFENLTLLASETADVEDGNLFLLNVPFEGTVIPAGSTVVLELFTASGNDGNTPVLTLAGQPSGAQGISYLASTGCGISEPTDVDAVGLGDIPSDWIINLNGGGGISQTAGLGSGSTFPFGTTTEEFTITDLTGNSASASFDVVVIGTPSDLTADGAEGAGITLNWTDNADAEDGYVLERSEDGTNFTVLAELDANTTTFNDATAGVNIEYTYRVAATIGDEQTDYSDVATFTIIPIPDAPTDLTAARVDGGISLTWVDNSDDEDSFDIQRSENGTDFASIGSAQVDVTTFTDVTIETGLEYFYRVAAVNVGGASDFSNVDVVIGIPSDLTADGAVGAGITLNWTDNSNSEEGYLIERSEDGTTFTLLSELDANTITFNDATAELNIEYTYRVAATVGDEQTDYTNVAVFTIELAIPAAPTNLAASRIDGSIALTWVDNSDVEDSFDIQRSEDGTNFTSIGSVLVDVTTFTDATAAIGVSYSYRVAAVNLAGTSDFSNVATFLITGIEDDLLSQAVDVSPNPSDGMYTVYLNDATLKSVDITLWGTDGRLIFSKTVKRTSISFEFNIDVRASESGAYILRIDTEDGATVLRKLVKQ